MFESFFKDPDPHDHELRKERETRSLPFSKNPFQLLFKFRKQPVKNAPSGGAATLQVESNAGDRSSATSIVEVNVSADVPWIDLLLDFAMTTAFSSLTNNTKIESGLDATSYTFFFLLVFWIWASQVSYNVRFRQEDHIHRIFVFLQLLVFGALASFTNQFNVVSGISKFSTISQISQGLALAGKDQNTINAELFRAERLPRLNSRGISLTMFFSRLILLAQYFLVVLYAKPVRRGPLSIPCVTLFVSAIMYLTAFLVIGKSGTSLENELKLPMWYLPILLEITSHFVAAGLQDSVHFPGEALYARYSTVFTIILGGGLDAITGVFGFAVGTIGFGGLGVAEMFSSGIIFLGYFSLYFEGSSSLAKGNRRRLCWQFLHLPFLTSLILVLQAVSNVLRFQDLYSASTYFFNSFTYFADHSGFQGSPVDTAQVFNATLLKLGISLDDEIAVIQSAAFSQMSAQNKTAQVYRWCLNVYVTLFTQFDAMPDPLDPVSSQITLFNNNVTFATKENFGILFADLSLPLVKAVEWFMATGGSALMLLAVLNVVQRTPTDRYLWGSFLNRFLGGFIFASLTTFLSFGDAVLDWVESGWMLPSLAILLVLVSVVDWVLLYKSAAYYRSHPSNPHTSESEELLVTRDAAQPRVTFQQPKIASSEVYPFASKPQPQREDSTGASSVIGLNHSPMMFKNRMRQLTTDSDGGGSPLVDASGLVSGSEPYSPYSGIASSEYVPMSALGMYQTTASPRASAEVIDSYPSAALPRTSTMGGAAAPDPYQQGPAWSSLPPPPRSARSPRRPPSPPMNPMGLPPGLSLRSGPTGWREAVTPPGSAAGLPVVSTSGAAMGVRRRAVEDGIVPPTPSMYDHSSF